MIVKLYALGDILMATPLLRALKRDYPECEIFWLVDKHYAEALQANPLITEVIAFDTGRWRRLLRRGNVIRYALETRALRRRLDALRLDVVINLHADKWWSAWFNAARERVGVFYTSSVGRIGALYSNVVPQTQIPKRLHNSEHYLHALQAIGIKPPYDLRMVLEVAEPDRVAADQFLALQYKAASGRPLIVLHPGTSRLSKNWLPGQWSRLSELLSEFEIVITGSPSEHALAKQITAESDRRDLSIASGELPSLGATAALIARAAAVITGDTAALHMASALDTPLVGLYGATRPRSNAPLFGASAVLYDDSVPCAPCYLPRCPLQGNDHMRCMKAISPEQVASAARRVAEGTADLASPATETNDTYEASTV